MNVVVVESPAKAKTIEKYLGPGWRVLASFGHVRDLPAKTGSVIPDKQFEMLWEIDPKADARLKDIARAVKDARHLYLATDPDREGEAISWHVRNVLEERNALKGIDVKRVVFNEVTKGAVLEAMQHPRELNQELIDAYLARRALDYLVGFTLSPVLWRKLPGSRSAGRVQSVALRLICEREAEIEAFKTNEYWTVEVACKTAGGQPFMARLIHLNGRKLDKFDLANEAAAKGAAEAIAQRRYAIGSVERKTIRRNPFPPFTTSTLQQEASRKLGLSATRTMQVAQRLYEGVDLGGETVGLITYMRTDGVQLSQEAITAARALIQGEHGPRYLPGQPRVYKTQAKNAQEAHEAIRPTDVTRRPKDIGPYLDRDQLRLYELIWKRTIASQMQSAELDQTTVDIVADDRQITLRATGTVIAFDGFLILYQEDRDDADEDEDSRLLPRMAEGEPVERGEIKPEQHFTQPPPRYSEASLVKRLEELGIGRPSTYASIMQVLQDRDYVRLEKRRFVPEDRGRLVTAFLASFFTRYVEYGFTADLEGQLDEISGGRVEWRAVLNEFWRAFEPACEEAKQLPFRQVLDALDETLGRHFFPETTDGRNPRQCPACANGRLGIKLGKKEAFIGCANYPECRYTRSLGIGNGAAGDGELAGPKLLGNDPATGLPVSLRKGPFGLYVQLGEMQGEAKPKRASLPKGRPAADVDLAAALALLALPRPVGPHPETGEMITAGIGRFGPYVKVGPRYKSLDPDDDVLTIGLNRAVDLLAATHKRQGPTGKELGPHPEDGKPVLLFETGRYGPYVGHGKVYATLPRGQDPAETSLEQALALIAARAARGPGKKKFVRAKAKAATPAKSNGPGNSKGPGKNRGLAESEGPAESEGRAEREGGAKSKGPAKSKGRGRTKAPAETAAE
jgi:DNA topoisomerase-1